MTVPGQDVDGSSQTKTVLAWKQKHGHKPLLPGSPGYLTAGERGYMRSMYQVLQTVYNDPTREYVLVLDDDALFTCTFEQDLDRLLSESRYV